VVEAGPTTQLTIDQPNLGEASLPEVGARVAVSWPVAHSLILPD
jgi:hypothetical protein